MPSIFWWVFLSKYVSVRSAAAGRKGEGTKLAGFAGSLKRTELAGSAGSLCLNLSPFKPIKPINPKGPKLTDPDGVIRAEEVPMKWSFELMATAWAGLVLPLVASAT